MSTTPSKAESAADNFRSFLKQELMKRCERNSRYSLRAFARSLDISHATLSHILAGRRKLTSKMIKRIGHTLGMDPAELASYVAESAAGAGQRGLDGYPEMNLDTFSVISEWYHDAIMELTHLKNFQDDPRWIARVLGVTVSEVNLAVERLQKLNLLEIKNGKWRDLSPCNTTPLDPSFTATALKKYQKKILSLSTAAIGDVAKIDREHVSNMLSIQKSDLPEVRKRITKFRSQLAAFLQKKNKTPNEVYQLSVSFFPLTKGGVE
jgi:transcriptional regulator with XRE-family HTH domain